MNTKQREQFDNYIREVCRSYGSHREMPVKDAVKLCQLAKRMQKLAAEQNLAAGWDQYEQVKSLARQRDKVNLLMQPIILSHGFQYFVMETTGKVTLYYHITYDGVSYERHVVVPTF
jgi:hypothetical protein